MKNTIDATPKSILVIVFNSTESYRISTPPISANAEKMKAVNPRIIRIIAPTLDAPLLVSGIDANPSINKPRPATINQPPIKTDSNDTDLSTLNSSIGATQKNSSKVNAKITALGSVILYPNALTWSTITILIKNQ